MHCYNLLLWFQSPRSSLIVFCALINCGQLGEMSSLQFRELSMVLKCNWQSAPRLPVVPAEGATGQRLLFNSYRPTGIIACACPHVPVNSSEKVDFLSTGAWKDWFRIKHIFANTFLHSVFYFYRLFVKCHAVKLNIFPVASQIVSDDSIERLKKKVLLPKSWSLLNVRWHGPAVA